jgi:cytoskeleton protein RodZ
MPAPVRGPEADLAGTACSRHTEATISCGCFVSAESTNPETVDARTPAADGSIAPELTSLGLKLLQARQARGLEASELADRLHIGREQIEAIETADLARLPEPVFVIAQARRLAGALELDLEPQLQALRQSPWMRQRTTTPKPSTARARPAAAAAQRPVAAGARPAKRSPSEPPLLPIAIGGLTAIGLVLAALWGVQQAQKPPSSANRNSPAAIRAAASTPAATRPEAATASLTLASDPASWVEVRDNRGISLFRGTLSASRRFPLSGGVRVLAGRPDLVRAAVGSNPAQPLGSISDVRWRALTQEPVAP